MKQSIRLKFDSQAVIQDEETLISSKQYTKLMCNYFSIGVESRIGLGFDKRRTGSVFCNKLCYGWEGLKKMCCCCVRTQRIRQVIDYVSAIDHLTGSDKILFATNPKKETESFIKGNPVSFVCTNINSMMGG